MADPSRRRVTYSQLETLWEVLSKRKDIAMGFNKTSQARECSRKMWEELAFTLNSQDGAEKDWKGWCKYWNDYKCKLKKLAASIRRSHQQTGGGPSFVTKCTDIEKKFLLILGENYGFSLPGIRVDPFEEEVHESTPISGGSESILTGFHLHNINEPGTSQHLSTPTSLLPPTPKTLPPTPTPLQPTPTAPPSPPSNPNNPPTPQRVPMRRRNQRDRITAEVARRFLMQESRRRTAIDEQNSAMLRELIDELRQIKEILKLNGRPTGGT